MDNRQANINRFEAEMTKVTRDGVDKLMAFIRKSDMYAAPASTRFHLSVAGDLAEEVAKGNMYFNAIEKDGKLHITGRVSARF